MNEESMRYDTKRAATLSGTLSEMLAAFETSAASVVAAGD
jgi:hypothetical protein